MRIGDAALHAEAADRRQVRRVRDTESIGGRDHQPAERRKRLRIPEHAFALVWLREQLRQPGDGGDELDTDADEDETAKHEQHLDRRGIA
jgi:hypothetical protein